MEDNQAFIAQATIGEDKYSTSVCPLNLPQAIVTQGELELKV